MIMEHLNLFYLFITLVSGVISLGVVGFVYIKTRDSLIGYYLGFYLTFTAIIVSNALTAYIEVNLPQAAILPVVKFFLSTVARFALVGMLPIFIDHLCAVSHARGRKLFFGGLALVLAIAYQILEFVPDNAIEDVGDVVIDVVFMATMLYPLIIGLSRVGKLHDTVRERLLRKFLMLFGSFLPGLMLDTLLSEFFSVPIQIFPFLYCGCSIVFTHHFLKYYTAHPIALLPAESPASVETANSLMEAPQEKPPSDSPEDVFFTRYKISPREQEVARLIIQGYSNQQIGETLFISINTVKAHVKKIYAKCDVNSRYELMALLNNPKS